jgi:hypothetical protein
MTGRGKPAGMILVIALLASLLLVAAASAQSGTVTRGGTFTVTVYGIPRTPYNVWPEGTSDMTGEPGDQPPVIVPGQADVMQDPAGGPYTIGSHPVSGGGTIRDDVPPDSSTTPATSYYAEVKTDASGYGTVMFQTSSATATDRQFHITAQNPADLDEEVRISLGGIPGPEGSPGSEGAGAVPRGWGPSGGSRDRPGGEGNPLDGIPATPAPTPVMVLPIPTTLEGPVIPAATTTVPVTEVQPSPAPTMAPPFTPSPEATPGEITPSRAIPLTPACCLAAIGIGLLLRAMTITRKG